MPLDNFSNLKASIKRRSKRNDVTDADLTDYIAQCESEFYNNMTAPLRIRAMEARATASTTTTSRFLELPDLFLQMRRLKLNDPFGGSSGDTDLRYYTPEQMPLRGLSGVPCFFTITTQLEFDATPDQVYTVDMQYVKKLPALDDTNTTNAILTDSPNVYLFGSLWALFQEFQEADLATYYYGNFIQAIQGANAADQAGRYGPAPVIRKEGYTP